MSLTNIVNKVKELKGNLADRIRDNEMDISAFAIAYSLYAPFAFALFTIPAYIITGNPAVAVGAGVGSGSVFTLGVNYGAHKLAVGA